MAYFLGIDGGGSKTTCVVGDARDPLGRAHSGGSNLLRVGEESTRKALHSAILEACKAAGVEPAKIMRTCAGVAGAARSETADAVRRLIGEVIPSPIDVLSDVSIAMEAAFGGAAGVIVIAGTGSICYGRNEFGETARAGGWGPAVSDQGSGDWIGRTAVAAMLRALDSGDSASLLPLVLEEWQLATRDELTAAINAPHPPDFARLFPHVLAAATAGDTLAGSVISQAGIELGELARAVIRQLWRLPKRVQVRISGGVFQNSETIRHIFVNTLRAERPEAAVSLATVDPVAGALALARTAFGNVPAHSGLR